MRLGTHRVDGEDRACLVVGDEIVDLPDALRSLGITLPRAGLRPFLELPDWRGLGAQVAAAPPDEARRWPLGSAEFRPPVPDPSKVLVAGANTRSHIEEARPLTGAAAPNRPMFLAKASTAICGPRDPIVKPPETSKLDYEVEVGVVIGRPARRLTVEDALDAVAGCMVVNDVSARDIQLADYEDNPFYRTHFLGKSFDSFCPSGPVLVTLDELPALADLRLRTWVNGEVRQDSTVADLWFPIPVLVSFLSSVMTLLPGDVICTGSPAGVAYFRQPPAFLKEGDIVICEVTSIGRLENRVVAETGIRSAGR